MTAREWLDGLDLLHGAIYRGIEDQRRLTMEHDAIPELVARLRAVLDLTYASDDGSEYEHDHGIGYGCAECPACWAEDIRRAVEGTDL